MGSKRIAEYSVLEVCELVKSLQLDPAPFKENAVEGSDLLELTDQEMQEYLQLKPLQVKKIRKRINDVLSEEVGDGEEESGSSIMDKFKAAVQQSSAPPSNGFAAAAATSQPSSGFGGSSGGSAGGFGGSSGGFGGSGGSDSFGGSGGSSFGGSGARSSSTADPSGRPPPPLKPAERGFGRTVVASGEELAERDAAVESELFDGTNTGINFNMYERIPAEITGNNAPAPIDSFTHAKLDPRLLSNIQLANYDKPTPVQRYALAVAQAGRDLMACAQTGSGKTAAFLFPMISYLLTRGKSVRDQLLENGSRFPTTSPEALILAPTRELATQIYDEARKFCYRTWVRPVVIYGGTQSIRSLNDMQTNGCHLMVATPGRLNDFIGKRKVSLRNVKFLVLDEADRMLDMGFEEQIRNIVEKADLPKERQTLLFSATFPKEIQRLASDFLNDYLFLTIGRVGSTSSNIKQIIEYVEETDKHARLLELCNVSKGLTLIFVQTKREADSLEEYLTRQGFPAVAIHGDREQWQREETLDNFKKGTKPFLVATDVAQRGLDIPNVLHVINFDMPSCVDDYVHRIGRTGRVGRTGVATSFFNNQDTGLAADLVELLKEVGQPVPEWLAACASASSFGGATRYSSRDARGGGGGGRRDNNGGGGGGFGGFGGSTDAPAASSGGWD